MSATRFKVGDHVRVRNDLIGGYYYFGQYPNGCSFENIPLERADLPVYFNSSMNIFKGMEFVITAAYTATYNLKDVGTWQFNDQMLEPAHKIDISQDELLLFLKE